MIGRRGILPCAALFLLAAAPAAPAAPAGSEAGLDGYRLRVPIVVDAGARVQRLELPAAVLAVLQTRDGHDVRIFDARGRAMPVARGVAPAVLRRDRLAALLILGAPDALRISGVSLRLDGDDAARVVAVTGEPVAAGGAAVVLGVLFDARGVTGRADRLAIAADLPAGQPVTLIAEASRNLRDWRPLGEATVYRRADAVAGPSIVPLHAAPIARDYLRVTWRAGSRLLTPVVIHAAILDTRTDDADVRILAARAPKPADPRIIDIAMPFATPIASLRILPAAADGVVPVRILGRDDREQPWAVLGAGLALADGSRAIALAGDTPPVLRIAADDRSAGFTRAPMLRIGYAGRSLIFLTSGAAPFTLAAGRADAGDPFLSAGDLTDGQGRPGTARLALPPGLALALSAPADAGASTRRLILWAVLLAATAVLAGVAWLVWRRDVHAGPDPAV